MRNRYKSIYWYHNIFKKSVDWDFEASIRRYCSNANQIKDIWEAYLDIKKENEQVGYLSKETAIITILSLSEKIKVDNGLCHFFLEDENRGKNNLFFAMEIVKQIFEGLNYEYGKYVFRTMQSYKDKDDTLISYTDESVTNILFKIFDNRIDYMQIYKEEIIWCGDTSLFIARFINFFKPFRYE